MFNYGPPPMVAYELHLIENGETIDKLPYPMVPNLNDTINLGNGNKSFTITESERIFDSRALGFRMPIFQVKLFGTLKIDETISNDTETLEDKETS